MYGLGDDGPRSSEEKAFGITGPVDAGLKSDPSGFLRALDAGDAVYDLVGADCTLASGGVSSA